MINFVIRSTTTLGMIVIALVVYNIYPHNTFNNHLIIALCCWLTAFGPIYWIAYKLDDMLTDDDWRKFFFYTFSITQLGLLIAGLVNLAQGCFNIS